MSTEERLDRIEHKLDHIINFITEMAHDSAETHAASVQLKEVYKNLINEIYDLRLRFGAPGQAPRLDARRAAHDEAIQRWSPCNRCGHRRAVGDT